MLFLYVIGFLVVALLVAFLCHRQEARHISRIPDPGQSGSAFDARPVSERIQRVRRDYLAVVYEHPHDRSRRERLHAAAHQLVRQLAYFHRSEAEPSHSPNHEAHTHVA